MISTCSQMSGEKLWDGRVSEPAAHARAEVLTVLVQEKKLESTGGQNLAREIG